MDLHQLEIFVQVAERRGFASAASALHLSQPTVSAHIAALERELQTQLIRRTTRQFELTPQGERLYVYASSILKLRNKAVRELSGGDKTVLHIGASSVPGQCLLPQVLTVFHAAWPQTQLQIVRSDSVDVIQRVSEGSLDLGLVGTQVESASTFVPIAEDELIIAAPNLPQYRQLYGAPLPVLLQQPFLLRADHSGTLREAEQYLTQIGLPLQQRNIIAHISDPEILRRCIVQGLGISIVSRRTVAEQIEQGTILPFPLRDKPLTRKLYLVYLPGSYLPKTVADFAATVCRMFPMDTASVVEQ